MDHFTDEHSKLFLDKEWLVKIDTEHATPYLFKFHASAVDFKSSCCILVTDTKVVWFECDPLSSNQFARRWRENNPLRHNASEERPVSDSLRFLSNAHSIGNVADLSFEIVKTNYSDLAFELESEVFKWRWECNFVGPKFSADILSKQLIMPLMSVSHLAINSADSVSELSDQDLEKAVDKVGRTARRAVDTHVKNTLSKPRLATTLRRMTALFNLTQNLPSILSSADKKDLGIPEPDVVRLSTPHQTPTDNTDVQMTSPRAQSPSGDDWLKVPEPYQKQKEGSPFPEFKKQSPKDDSATDISDDEKPEVPQSKSNRGSASLEDNDATVPKQKMPIAMKSKIIPSSSDEDLSSAPPSKKVKQKPDSSDVSDDSDSEPKRRGTSAGSSSKRGGVRQPIKRGGRRF